ncbi:hypothetical protein GUITHDRAFT_160957 [Guillardia theta CCMP2712]|uniref:NAD-dependent epimerase/dehydratase domain-containing protein n=1 Tax=Guillardia theta (strain CCMP2712) TaxID=905079 RepID=L1JZU0_GUITC|nr:hypothetical protein GUITHDRAFT_160957 [Guillardia theta CCMP2712]EKX53872.1 hypothetical protein GUITHDRAFT_160957 [Guillardia theta CCMP2712]|eukprot:XP_005840852.1 hypothetical protein GUITHDRAFT_160957 [Guillardia theta CCMP2712]
MLSVARRSGRSVFTQTKRFISTEVLSLRGGRSSVTGVVATVFGSTGFVARYVVNKLGRVGTQCVVPHRIYSEDRGRHLKVMGDLGMIVPMPFHARDPESIAECVKESDVVINLMGKQEKTFNFDFFGSNVEAVSTLAKISKECGVPRFIHLSSVAADEQSESTWLRCKALGEKAVLDYYPNAAILRSNVIFGEEDKFLNNMAKWARIYGYVPIIGSGKNIVHPIYVDDVAEAIRACTYDDSYDGQIVELNGPEAWTLPDIANWVRETCWIAETSRIRRFPDLSEYLPESLKHLSPHNMVGGITDSYLGLWPSDVFGPMSMLGIRGDFRALNCNSWTVNKRLPQIDSFDIVPTKFTEIAPEYLRNYRPGGHFSVLHKKEDVL